MPRRSKKFFVSFIICLLFFAGYLSFFVPQVQSSLSSVTITNIALPQSTVESGFVLPINVTVQNNGNVSETANVKLFANSTSIFNGTLSVNSSASGILNCLVNTESLPIGNYTINVSVTALGEPNVTPSTMSAGTVGVTYVGDLNGDFKVDCTDFFIFMDYYISYWNTGYANPAVDFGHDGKIDSGDALIFTAAYINYQTQEASFSKQAAPTQSSTPTSTPTPSPTPTSPPSGNSLPLSCLGDDYLISGNFNGDPSYWVNQLHYFTQYHCTCARLAFTFADCPGAGQATFSNGEDTGVASTLVYSKLDAVLNYLGSVGVKAIICDWASFAYSDGVVSDGWYGSSAWFNDWVALATHFAGDSRIEAFEITSEPWNNMCCHSAQTVSGFDAACGSLIDAIRAVDPSRTIMYPNVVGIISSSPAAFYSDLVAKGIPAKGNILYDIIHPYYFEDYPAMDPVNNPIGDADWIWNTYCLPQIAYFGASDCWCGETFPWPSNGAGGWNGQTTIHYAIQQQFEIAMINHFVAAGMGFQMWGFFSSTQQQADIDALTNSNYYSLVSG